MIKQQDKYLLRGLLCVYTVACCVPHRKKKKEKEKKFQKIRATFFFAISSWNDEDDDRLSGATLLPLTTSGLTRRCTHAAESTTCYRLVFFFSLPFFYLFILQCLASIFLYTPYTVIYKFVVGFHIYIYIYLCEKKERVPPVIPITVRVFFLFFFCSLLPRLS